MSSDRRERHRWLLAPLLLAALGCADFSRGAPSPDTGGAATPGDGGTKGDGGTLSFAADITPLLATCTNCHVAGGQASDTSLVLTGNAAADYAAVVALVDTAAPASSRILSKVSGNGHGGGTIYAAGTPQYEIILAWIQQGAPP